MHQPQSRGGPQPPAAPAAVERFGPIIPQYGHVAREAGNLAIGEVVREPHLGLARVAGVEVPEPGSPFVQVAWKDDRSWSTAAVRYPADLTLPVRIPAEVHRLHIEQGIIRATYLHREIVPAIARLIAVHLHQGPKSAIYRFARDGAIADAFYDELDDINRHQPSYKSWVNALASFALSRIDTSPIPGWRTGDPTEESGPVETMQKTNDAGRQEVREAVLPGGARIWIGHLADDGELEGQWFDATKDPTQLFAEALHVLNSSIDWEAKEWGIFDYHGFGDQRIEDLERLAPITKLAKGIEQHGPAFAAWANHRGPTQLDKLDRFPEHYLGHWPSTRAFIESHLNDIGFAYDLVQALSNLPLNLSRYIILDMDAMASEWEQQLHVVAHRGGVWLFRP